MAGQTLNLRNQRDLVDEAAEAVSVTPSPASPKKNGRAKDSTLPKVKKVRAKKTPVRLRAHWGVFDSAMKQVALFDYNQRAVAEEKAAELMARAMRAHFLQVVKLPMLEPAPAVTLAAN